MSNAIQVFATKHIKLRYKYLGYLTFVTSRYKEMNFDKENLLFIINTRIPKRIACMLGYEA